MNHIPESRATEPTALRASLESPALALTLDEVMRLLELRALRTYHEKHDHGNWTERERLIYMDLALEEVMKTGRWPRS